MLYRFGVFCFIFISIKLQLLDTYKHQKQVLRNPLIGRVGEGISRIVY